MPGGEGVKGDFVFTPEGEDPWTGEERANKRRKGMMTLKFFCRHNSKVELTCPYGKKNADSRPIIIEVSITVFLLRTATQLCFAVLLHLR